MGINAECQRCERPFGSVSVKISLDEDELVFSHNGLPFEVNHLLGIVKQVSTKSSSGEDGEVTGKFGTGFIVTHLLSDTIDVQGYIHDGNGRYFRLDTLHLDRSGQTSEELIPKIKEANEYILKVEKDRTLFPLEQDYKKNKRENSFDTVFKYNLTSERKKEAAKEGVADLKNTLPITLVSVEEISEVIIEDRINSNTYIYQMTPILEEFGVKMIRVEMKDAQSRNFLKYIQDDFCLIAEVTDFDSFSLVEKKDDQPVLYRNFPLIGSENFHFPFILNGFEFNPTEDRNDIILVHEESNEVLSNRSVLESAVEGVIEFTEYLISKNAKNRHLCAFSRIPKLSVPIEESLKDWLEELQRDWRKQLIDLDLIGTEEGAYSSLRKCRLPNHGSTNEQKDHFHYIACCFLGKDLVPKEEQNLSWISMTGPKSELESWQLELWYDLKDLLTELTEIGNLNNLQEKVDDPIEWLNKLYAFINEVKETEFYDDYSIIPNHLGSFNKLEDLYLEDQDSTIPEPFLDILESLDENWRDDLIYRKLKLTGISVKSKGLSDVSKTINDILNVKERNSVGIEEYQFKARVDALTILKDILRNVDSNQANDFRCKVFHRAKAIFDFEDDLDVVSNVRDFQFSIAIKLLIMFIHEEIEARKNIDGFADKLKLDNTKSVFWLNEYFELILNKEDFKTQIEYGNIIPNRLGEFCAYEDVYAFGSEETSLDDELIQILYELDENQNWKQDLVYDGISLKLEPKKFEELGLAVDNALKEIVQQEAAEETPNQHINQYKNVILDLIKWCRANKSLADEYMKYVVSIRDKLFIQFSMTDQFLDFLGNENNQEVLSILVEADLNLQEIKKLISMVGKLDQLGVDGMSKILEHAEDLLEEEEHFHFMRETGENVEEVILKALEEENIEGVIIKQRGKGSHDLQIYREANSSKIVKLEVKSYTNESRYPFKFAPSQIKESINSDSFLVCILERPNEGSASIQYVRERLQYRSSFSSILNNQVLKDIEDFQRIEESGEKVKLVIHQDGRPRIYVDHNLMKENCRSFQGLISAIKQRLS